MAKRIVVEAPASSANLGCGFDIFALALASPMDRLTIQRSHSGFELSVKGGGILSERPERNIVLAVARAMRIQHKLRGGATMTLTKGVPVGAGLGSSGASSAAAAVGIDRLYGLGLSERELVRFAGIGEKAASGAAHLDNVAASLAGGFVVLRKDGGFARMEAPRRMAACLVTPKVRLPREKTQYARSLLPRSVPLRRAVEVAGAASMLVHGFATGSIEEIGEAMNWSLVDEPRSGIIPGYELVKRAAISRGASGVCISGAGPTVLAVCRTPVGGRVLRAMQKAFREKGVESSGFITRAGGGCGVTEA